MNFRVHHLDEFSERAVRFSQSVASLNRGNQNAKIARVLDRQFQGQHNQRAPDSVSANSIGY
jgi:hypothetical protein